MQNKAVWRQFVKLSPSMRGWPVFFHRWYWLQHSFFLSPSLPFFLLSSLQPLLHLKSLLPLIPLSILIYLSPSTLSPPPPVSLQPVFLLSFPSCCWVVIVVDRLVCCLSPSPPLFLSISLITCRDKGVWFSLLPLRAVRPSVGES